MYRSGRAHLAGLGGKQLILNGQAASSLLATYEEERIPVGKLMVEQPSSASLPQIKPAASRP
jgi:hypothetical protein